MMVLGTDYPMDWVNEHPAEERAALLAGTPPFDYAQRAGPARGRLARRGLPAAARHPGQRQSERPLRRARRRAAALLADQPWHDYYGPGSPLEKLCDWGGRILRLGADPETVTALHYAEYLADLPDKRRARWDYVLAGADGRRAMSGSTASTTSTASPTGTARIISRVILKAYLALGRHREGWSARREAS